MTLLEMLNLLRKNLVLVVCVPVACVLAAGAICYGLMDDSYTASTSMYVLARDAESSADSLSTELSASQMISNDVSTLLVSERVKGETARSLGLADLEDFDIEVTNETTSRVVGLSVTGSDAQTVANVANTMVEEVSSIAREVMDIESVNAIDRARPPEEPSGPNRPLYMAVALVAGFFAAVAIVMLIDMLDTRVRSYEEVEELLGIPVIGRIPTMKGAR